MMNILMFLNSFSNAKNLENVHSSFRFTFFVIFFESYPTDDVKIVRNVHRWIEMEVELKSLEK